MFNLLEWVDSFELANRPKNGKDHSYFDFTDDPKNHFSSDAVQFYRANKALIDEMNTNPAFKRDMLGRYPSLSN